MLSASYFPAYYTSWTFGDGCEYQFGFDHENIDCGNGRKYADSKISESSAGKLEYGKWLNQKHETDEKIIMCFLISSIYFGSVIVNLYVLFVGE